jgi:hypothetical protein
VADGRTLKVIGFFSVNDAAKDLELTVSGTLVRQGPRLTTASIDPIVIRARAGKVLRLVPEAIRDRFVRIKDNRPVSKIDPEEMVPMYRITFGGDVTSVF